MHPNRAFHTQDAAANRAFARARGFGMLAVAMANAAPMLSHVPFLLDEDGARAHLHLVRSNPIARALTKDPLKARIAVSGPDSYVSPDWYGVPDQVPTWNYVAVHLIGVLELRPEKELRALLDRQSAHFEDRLRPKAPWTSAKMTPDLMERMMRQIVPCAFLIDSVEGTWKMNQNKPETARLRAADHVSKSGMGMETAELAEMTRRLGDRPG